MIFYLALKNILSRKSSIVIIIFIAFALTLMTVINSVFESTEHGVETVYTNSFTGDLVIRPKNNVPLSLFGDETPVTGELTAIETLIPYSDIKNHLLSLPQTQSVVPQVSCATAMEVNGRRTATYVFGVPGTSYVTAMPSIQIVEGEPYADSERGVMLSSGGAARIGAKIGDTVQFIVQDGLSFRIRAATLTAIYDYAVKNAILDRIALADAYTVRSLLNLTDTASEDTYAIAEEKTDLLDSDFDIEDLFGSAFDTDEFILEDSFVESVDQDSVTEQIIDPAASSTWNYLIVRLAPGTAADSVIRSLNRTFRKNGWPVEAMNWRNAAGSTALYLYWMRLIFNVGVLVVLAAGFIIINNTLVVSVLNRTQEIGTLRAQGASRRFITLQCMIETFLLTLTAGIIACILGYFASNWVSGMNITFSNAFLKQLFGSDTLQFATSVKTMGQTLALSLLLGIVGWMYPVRAALKITPVQAMQGAS